MFVVWYDRKEVRGFVECSGGAWVYHRDPRKATTYATREEASQRGKPGHHRDMGGDGFHGTVVELSAACRSYDRAWDLR